MVLKKQEFDIVAVGELLIDFTPVVINGEIYYKQNPGGAPANFLTAAQRYGAKTAFIGKIGKDSFGYKLKEAIEDIGIGTTNLVLTEKYNTTLAFVHLDKEGERSFSFYRKNCADIMLEKADIDYGLLDNTKALHFGSLSFTDEPSRSTVRDILSYAQKRGIIISYDPNYRAPLWPSEEIAVKEMKAGLQYADILKVSEQEAVLITGESSYLSACKVFRKYGPRLIFITLGEDGAFYYHQNGYGLVEGKPSRVLDTTGAGDTFFGSVVAQFIEKNIDLDSLNTEVIEEILDYANTAAAMCIECYGGIPAIPCREKVKARIKGK